ncbi:hypothetical protein GP486_006262 [Trichoglossum hirsutum]|uniref:Serine protease n=1 Tax=Trichoglossum hirsutum TaxID=265104 RepID=A0A9P8IH64_9PEZI|nr:hypothetical protein GP486_006262 [Trichoglossum hirsutum]
MSVQPVRLTQVTDATESALISSGLRTAAVLNQMTNTIVGRWDLTDTDSKAPEEASFYSYSNGHDESVINEDSRVPVDGADIRSGGVYRSVVKLFLRYQNQKPNDPWAMATGWLIKDDIMVTAGHCAFDWTHKMGRLTQVKAYIGYHGKESIGEPSVQFRKGKRVVTTSEWLTAPNRSHDVSLIQLTKPFTDVKPIKYADTPMSDAAILGVVGFPGDLTNASGEPGAEMYQMFLNTEYDLAKSKDRMLEYEIDTYGGNSGSPVFRKSDMRSIGVHVYGGDVNSASVIGVWGNTFEVFLSAFNLPAIPAAGAPGVKSIPGLNFVSVPTSGAKKTVPGKIPNGGAVNGHRGGAGESFGEHEDDEGFFDDFLSTVKKAINIGAPIAGSILQAGLPIAFGPIGAPIGALAGVALRAAGKAAEFEMAGESFSSDVKLDDGLVERAILGEAALAGILSMSKETLADESLFSHLKDIIKPLAPIIKTVAPKVIGTVTEPALRIALDALSKQNRPGTEANVIARVPKRSREGFHAALTGVSLKGADPNAKAFVEALLESSPDAESIWGDIASIGSVIAKAIVPPGPVSSLISIGLSALAKSTESDFEGTSDASAAAAAVAISLDGLHQRAMLGEAALQALMQVPVEKLKEEGIFDIMASAIKAIAPTVFKAAPGIINAVVPIVKAALGPGGEFAIPVPNGSTARPPLKKAKSTVGLANGSEFLGAVDDWARGVGAH